MRIPAGINLFDLIWQFENNPLMPRKFTGLKDLEDGAINEGFPDLADYLKSWRLYIEYQIEAEHNVRESR